MSFISRVPGGVRLRGYRRARRRAVHQVREGTTPAARAEPRFRGERLGARWAGGTLPERITSVHRSASLPGSRITLAEQ